MLNSSQEGLAHVFFNAENAGACHEAGKMQAQTGQVPWKDFVGFSGMVQQQDGEKADGRNLESGGKMAEKGTEKKTEKKPEISF